jgi:hypothetical protein
MRPVLSSSKNFVLPPGNILIASGVRPHFLKLASSPGEGFPVLGYSGLRCAAAVQRQPDAYLCGIQMLCKCCNCCSNIFYRNYFLLQLFFRGGLPRAAGIAP